MAQHKGKKDTNFPNLRFPGFQGEWESIKLGESVLIKSGISPTNVVQKKGSIPFFKVEQLNSCEKYLDSNSTPYFTEVYSDLVKKNSIIFPKRGAAIMTNKVRIICQDALIDTNLMSLHIKNTQQIDNEYLYYFLLKKKLSKIADTSTIPQLNNIHINPILLPCPDIKEQQKISTFLSLIDERIETQNKIINQLESLMKGIIQSLVLDKRKGWKKQDLCDLLVQRKENNHKLYPVFSVSVSKGIVNQIEYLGRSFAAKDISNYNVVHCGDIVYTKSPTGSFPYGIIKQSSVEFPVSVSPLYGVYKPKNIYLGNILHYYFNSPVNTNNYLHSLVQKGAKNTINITNQRFLEKDLFLPIEENEIKNISNLLNTIKQKIEIENQKYNKYLQQKVYLLQNLFV